jgi:hypothetical protein
MISMSYNLLIYDISDTSEKHIDKIEKFIRNYNESYLKGIEKQVLLVPYSMYHNLSIKQNEIDSYIKYCGLAFKNLVMYSSTLFVLGKTINSMMQVHIELAYHMNKYTVVVDKTAQKRYNSIIDQLIKEEYKLED